jgi:hypothetical protein
VDSQASLQLIIILLNRLNKSDEGLEIKVNLVNINQKRVTILFVLYLKDHFVFNCLHHLNRGLTCFPVQQPIPWPIGRITLTY